MNWKTTYTAAWILFVIYTVDQLISLVPLFELTRYYYDYHYYILLSLIFLIIPAVFLPYFYELNKVITKKKGVTKKLRILEYSTYLLTAYFILNYVYSLFILFIYRHEFSNAFTNQFTREFEYNYLFQIILFTILHIGIVYVSINSYMLRKKLVGKYNIRADETVEYDIDKLKNKSYQDNSERIQLCKLCVNRKLNSATGITCRLTNEKPTFTTFCTVFILDEKEQEKRKASVSSKKRGFLGSWKAALLLSILGFIRAFLKGFDDPFGWVFLGMGILWLIAAIVDNSND